MRTRQAVDALACVVWAYVVWLLLTWSATAEQLLFGLAVAVVVGSALATLGPVIAPWRLFAPRRLVACVRLVAASAWRIVVANLALTRLIWGPRSRWHTGMIVVPTQVRSDGAVAGVGLITSLIVDNQLVDLHRSAAQLQYHAFDLPPSDAERRYERVNGPTERQIRAIEGERP